MTEMGSQSAVEDELERILRASGIESSPVDPSSMEFLRQLVVQKKKKKKKIPTTERRTQLEESPAGKQEGEERNGKPAAAYASNTAADNASHNNSNSNNNNNTTSSGVLSNSDATMIVEQLKMQTNLILSLQDKIQVLTAKVDDMELRASEDPTTSTTTATRTREQQDASGRVRIIRRDAHPIPPPRDAEAPRRANGIFGNRPVAAAAAAVPAAAGPQELQPNVFAWFFETTRLFWVLSRDYVRPIDGALLFKLVFMTTVVMARVSKNSNKNSSKNNKDPKILLVSALLMLGFLFHTRYIQYVYQFLWKQNVPGRVWKGEENITIPPTDQDDHQDNWNNNNNNNNNERENNQPRGPNPVPPRFRRPNQRAQGEAQPAAARRWWQQNDLLVGGVAPIENEHGDAPAAVNPAVAMVQGMYYLVGSFVFSIFPMWNPQGHRQRRPLREERLDADAAADVGGGGGGGGGDNNHNANNGNNDDDPRMIPQVQAPRDAMEAADDSDDDSEGEQN